MIVRTIHNRENPYVQINREALRHPYLSLKARGLWAFLLSFPNDWKTNMTHLKNTLPEGRSALKGAFDELIKYRFVLRVQYHGNKEEGTVGFQKNEYMIFEFPLTDEELKDYTDSFRKNCIHSGQIKNSSVQAGFLHAQILPAQNPPLRKKEGKKNERKREREGAEPPKPPARPSSSLKKRAEEVATSDEDHALLIQELGEEKIILAYRELSEWKLNTPSSRWKLNDYLSIRSWVIQRLNEQEALKKKQPKPDPANDPKKIQKDVNRDWLVQGKKKVNRPDLNQYIYDTYDYVEFSTVNGEEDTVRIDFSDKNFREKVTDELKRRKYTVNNS